MSRITQRSGFLALGAASLAAVATLAAVLVGGPSAAGHDPTGAARASAAGGLDRIVGSVGPGFTISVSPRRVQPGRYRLVIHDRSSMHNWHITGPGVNEKTTVAFQGTQRFAVRLTPGRYRIVCDPHATTMVTHLRVRR